MEELELLQKVYILGNVGEDRESDFELPKVCKGEHAAIVDISNAHGLCYGVVFPNKKGSSAREKNLQVFWFEPDEIEMLD